jgi:hypothetical protein
MPNRLNAMPTGVAVADALRGLVAQSHARRLAEQQAIENERKAAAAQQQQEFENNIKLRQVVVSERQPRVAPIQLRNVSSNNGRPVTRFLNPEDLSTLAEVPEHVPKPEKPVTKPELTWIDNGDGTRTLVQEREGLTSKPQRAPVRPNYSTMTMRDPATGQDVLVRVDPEGNRVEPMPTGGLVPRPTGADGGGGVRLSAASQAKLQDVTTARGLLNDMAGIAGANQSDFESWLGPVQGRLTRARPSIPDGLPGSEVKDNLAAYLATEATLKNQVIKAITGAAMGVEEEKRILAQLPNITNKPNVWRQNLMVSLRNLDRIEEAVYTAAGGRPDAPRKPAPTRAGGPGAAGGGPVSFVDPVTGRTKTAPNAAARDRYLAAVAQ